MSLPIRRFPFADHLVLLLSQHAGRPAVATVREGQQVLRGEPVARADGFVSAPIHAPATGTITRIGKALDASGRMAPALILRPLPGSPQQTAWGTAIDVEALPPDQIIQAIWDMGMVGLGGAAFPTHVKLLPGPENPVDTFIVNGCECEPCLTADHRVMLERAPDVLLGTRLVQRALGARRSIIAVESNKPDAAEALRELASDYSDIEIVRLTTKYPQGAEKMLTRALLGRDVPSGKLPAAVGVVVSNVTTLAEVGELLPRGQGLIERVITVTGAGVQNPGNYLMPVGTPLDFILREVGMRAEAREVVLGGPMMGRGVAYLETPITKGVSGVVVLSNAQLSQPARSYPCIRCGRCLEVCPIHLNPSTLGMLARKHEYDVMAGDYHLKDCFECGCCSYVCPSHIPLVQQFRTAKAFLRQQAAAK